MGDQVTDELPWPWRWVAFDFFVVVLNGYWAGTALLDGAWVIALIHVGLLVWSARAANRVIDQIHARKRRQQDQPV